MATHARMRGSHAILATGRAAQAGWLLFVLLALSLALPGVVPYSRLLGTVCNSADCLIGQLTPAEAQAALASGFSLPEYADVAIITYLFAGTLLLLTAVALIWRKPTHGAAICGAFALAALATGTLAQAATRAVPALELPARLIQFVQLSALLPFFCLIPDGRFRPGWFRWAALVVVPAAALSAFDVVGPAASHAVGIVIGALIVGTVIHRYRSLPASPQQEQVAWALAAVALLVAAQWLGRPIRPLPLPAIPLEALPAGFFWFSLAGMLMVVGALTCLAVALLSDELFRVEVALNRALVYSLLTLFVVVGYALVVGYLSLIFQSSGSLWFSLAATGLVAVFFQSFRERVQRFVNQLLYGERDDPYAVLARLSQRLEAAFEPAAVLPSIVETVAKTLNLPYVAIAAVERGELSIRSEWHSADAIASTLNVSLITIPLIYQNEQLGEMRVCPRRGETTLAEADRRLLADLAQQASVAVHGVRLMNDLRDLTTDLQRSRERLVLAREEDRRRLRRDLHDDLAPMLAGLALTADTVADLIPTDPAKATALANDLNHSIRAAVSDIRRLVYDLRPPTLDELGLVAAIRERAAPFTHSADGLRVTVEADELPSLPAAVEVAAYRIAQEALMNVARHAQAKACHIRLALNDDCLQLEITDDGLGLTETRTPGVGLRSMQERAAELGGACVIERGLHGGMRVQVRLPISKVGAYEPTPNSDR